MAKRQVILELDDDIVEEAQRFADERGGDLDGYLADAIAEQVAGDLRYERVMADLRQRAADHPIDPEVRRLAEQQVEETLRRLDA